LRVLGCFAFFAALGVVLVLIGMSVLLVQLVRGLRDPHSIGWL
jgi:hypothetical protein